MAHDPRRDPMLPPGTSYASVTDHISALVLHRRLHRGWLMAAAVSFLGVMALLFAVTVLLAVGLGIWGVNVPVAWGFAIVNFVWWVGIGHAGTLISAFLLLMRQRWRTSINRFAEAMTIFAVICAGLFPLIHMGRPWFGYWLVPYPSTTTLWPQWRSPLTWDVFAIATYLIVSVMFWYMGLLPDLATLRDRARRPLEKLAYGLLALGWRGSARHWQRYDSAYVLMAALAAPLVVSVHSIVSLDFAVANLPGWHSTIFPPYFVAGAVFSGFAMVTAIAVPLRRYYGLAGFITLRHFDAMGKLMLAMGLLVAYGYVTEFFMAWLSGDKYEAAAAWTRVTGPYAGVLALVLVCNVLVPQVLWWRRVRRSTPWMFAIALAVLVGMWLERFMIVVTPLSRDYLPSSWGFYMPTAWDVATFVGTIALFFLAFLLFIRVLPVISIHEVRSLVDENGKGAE